MEQSKQERSVPKAPAKRRRRRYTTAQKLAIVREVSGWRSHLAELTSDEDDRVHLSFWWTREHFAERSRRWAAASPAQC